MIFAAEQGHAHGPLDHVLDSQRWESLQGHYFDIPWPLSKYTLLMMLAAALILAIYLPLARAARSGQAPRGFFWNLFETPLTFIRDNVAKPYIHEHPDRYVPYLWTIFLFVLFCNLLGMFPYMGSPTANIAVTGVLALVTFIYIHTCAIKEHGVKQYLHNYVPHLEIPFGLGYVIIPTIVVIEAGGRLIKASVLAVRLFANVFAGHLVLATLLGLIAMAAEAQLNDVLFWPISITTVLGVVALSLLELFVAFLQAFIFTFLTALFLGAELHPAH